MSKWPIDSKVLKGMKEMKSKVLISFLMASLVFLLFQVDGLAADPQTGQSKATIMFEVNDGETSPRDPEASNRTA